MMNWNSSLFNRTSTKLFITNALMYSTWKRKYASFRNGNVKCGPLKRLKKHWSVRSPSALCTLNWLRCNRIMTDYLKMVKKFGISCSMN